jgi:molybdenum cofactor cytidylyltransferase
MKNIKANDEKFTVSNCCAIILAAGGSSRLGSPKQLLIYRDETLLQRTINAVKHAGIKCIILVLGSSKDLILSQTDIAGVDVVENENWQTGIASSLATGIKALKSIQPLPDAAILMVCDQPYISSSILTELIAEGKTTGKPIIACEYENVTGVPALFNQSFFEQLENLDGDAGAKKIIKEYSDKVAIVPFPLGIVDIDTQDVYKKLI